jgi:hypothetical protein
MVATQTTLRQLQLKAGEKFRLVDPEGNADLTVISVGENWLMATCDDRMGARSPFMRTPHHLGDTAERVA